MKALAGVDQLWVAKGKRMTHVDLKNERPPDKQLVALLTGPTGNLRAPAIRRGRKLFVGFHPEAYRENLLA